MARFYITLLGGIHRIARTFLAWHNLYNHMEVSQKGGTTDFRKPPPNTHQLFHILQAPYLSHIRREKSRHPHGTAAI